MIEKFNESSLNLYIIPENRLVFKQNGLSSTKSVISPTKIMKQKAFSSANLKLLDNKNLLKKRVEIRKLFNSKESFYRTMPVKNNLVIVGRSESSDLINKPSRVRRINSNCTPKKQGRFLPPPLKLPNICLTNELSEDSLHEPGLQRKNSRRIITFASPSLEQSDAEDIDESVIIRPRYFNS